MWMIKRLCTMFLLALLLCSGFAGSCYASPTYTISANELETLQAHLNALERNNSELLNLLNASEMDLTEASLSLNESKKELETLRTQLVALQAETKQLSESLRIANDELKRASESFKASEKERDRIENRLRTQRNIWEALCAVAIGVAVARERKRPRQNAGADFLFWCHFGAGGAEKIYFRPVTNIYKYNF